MSLHPGITTLSSPNDSLGAGDYLFQAITGYNTCKLSPPTSPVQIIRQRYWCKPPHRKPLNELKDFSNEEDSSVKKRKDSIHASLEDLRNESLLGTAIVRQTSIPREINVMESSRSEIIHRREKSLAARRVYELLMLNAWRKRKEDSAGLTQMVHYLTAELEKYKMSLSVAKSFVKQETKRNQSNNVQISILSKRLDEQSRIKQALAEEKETSRQVIAELEEKLSHEETIRSNVLNDLIEVKNAKADLEAQLENEREKLNKLREEEASATAKVSELTEKLDSKSDFIVRLKKMYQNQKGILITMERQMSIEKDMAKGQREALLEEKKTLMRTIGSLESKKIELEGELRLREDKEKENEDLIESLREEIEEFERERSEERERALDLICECLDERRTMDLNAMARAEEAKFTATKFLSKVIKFPLNVLSSITYIFLPTKNYRKKC